MMRVFCYYVFSSFNKTDRNDVRKTAVWIKWWDCAGLPSLRWACWACCFSQKVRSQLQ